MFLKPRCFISVLFSQTNHGHISYCCSDSGAEKMFSDVSTAAMLLAGTLALKESFMAKAYMQGPLRFQRLHNVLLNKVLEFIPYPVIPPSFTKRSPHTRQVLARLTAASVKHDDFHLPLNLQEALILGFSCNFLLCVLQNELFSLCVIFFNFSFPWPGLWIQSSVAETTGANILEPERKARWS